MFDIRFGMYEIWEIVMHMMCILECFFFFFRFIFLRNEIELQLKMKLRRKMFTFQHLRV